MMAHPSAMVDNEDLIQLEDIKKEEDLPIEFPRPEENNCVVCLSRSSEIFNIHITTASGTELHSFIKKFANIELLLDQHFDKHVCRKCFDIVNVLEKAEIEYFELKKTFESIISKNPFCCLLPQSVYVKNEAVNYGTDSNLREYAENNPVSMKKVTEIKKEDIEGKVSDGFKIVLEVEPVDDHGSTMAVDEISDRSHGHSTLSRGGGLGQMSEAEKQKRAEGNVTNKIQHVSQRDAETQTSPNYFKTKRSYECDICNRIFHHKPNLQSHYRTHTGEKPYECNVCLQQFREKPHLQRHLRTHTGEKPYECVVCQRRFINSHHLKSHLATHTDDKPYECEVCKQPFKHLASMKRHMRRHTGEKPYECSVCQRRFSNSHHLQGHLRTHSNENPYKCDICQLEFKHLGKMKKHLKTHHMGETETSSSNVNSVFLAHTLLSVEHSLCSDSPDGDTHN